MKEHEKIILEKMKTYAAQAVQFKGDMDEREFIITFLNDVCVMPKGFPGS